MYYQSKKKKTFLLYQSNFATYDSQKKENDDFKRQYQNNKLKKKSSALKMFLPQLDWSQKKMKHMMHHRRIANNLKEQRLFINDQNPKIKDKKVY